MLQPTRSQRPAILTPEDRPLLAMSAAGDRLLVTSGGTIRVAEGPELMPASGAVAAAAVEGGFWIVTRDEAGHWLHRVRADGANAGAAAPLGELGDDVVMATARTGTRLALVEGAVAVEVREHVDGRLEVVELGARRRDRRVLLAGRGVIARRGAALVPASRFVLPPLGLPPDLAGGAIAGGGLVFDGAATLIEVESAGRHHLLIHDVRRGVLRSRIHLGEARLLAIAERRGLAIIGRDSHVATLDLRTGHCLDERMLPAPLTGAAIDAGGTRVVLLDDRGAPSELGWSTPTEAVAEEASEQAEAIEPQAAPDEESDTDARPRAEESHAETDAPAEQSGVVDGDGGEDASGAWEELPVRGLGRAAGSMLDAEELDEYLQDAFGWVEAMCRRARRRDQPDATEIMTAEADALAQLRRWAGRGAPHVELGMELGLSPVAQVILLVTAAPRLWGELAGSFAALSGPGRAAIDEMLLATILGVNRAGRAQIARELDDDAPLIRLGVIARADGDRPFAGLRVADVIIRRLGGEWLEPAPGAPHVRTATRALGEIIAPPGTLRGLLQSLAADVSGERRLVLRGRLGSGRRTLAAALAARLGRVVRLIDVAPEVAGGEPAEDRLRRQLLDARLRGQLPCVSGWDVLGDDAAVLRQRLARVLDAHPGPIILRGGPGAIPAVAPGYLCCDLAGLPEAQRRHAWSDALQRRGLPVEPAAAMAQRYRVGPGVAVQAVASVDVADARASEATLQASLETTLRQHRAERLAEIGVRVDRLASWDQLVVDDELGASLRELIGRVRLRGRVSGSWGLEAAGGPIVALFQGGPGTGKTMAAGAVARELGYELYRVDLSQVMSRWLGETEKNLGRVFDAAEDGDVILLFDEADSLFGKRTEVRSSNDRYANLEVNYLLQRLEQFDGVAILTTNFGTAIDPAFRRRLSFHLQFLAPERALRARLWRAHLPAALPTAGDLRIDELAGHELSGGYIKNAVVRAAYLAAAAGHPLAHRHLEQAIALEYRDQGRLCASGALD